MLIWKPLQERRKCLQNATKSKDEKSKEGEIPVRALWLCCAVFLGRAGPPGSERVWGDRDSGPAGSQTAYCTDQPVGRQPRGQNRSRPSGRTHTVQYRLRGHLVSVHGQQGFVDLNGLQLFLGQFVLNPLSIGQFHLFLGVKHILVLEVQRAQIKTLVTNNTDSISCSSRSWFLYRLTLLMVMMLLAVTASRPTSDGLNAKRRAKTLIWQP